MKSGMDSKAALEAAMADNDTRTLHFTTAFGMEAHTAQCRALTAPGLHEIYTNLPRVQKRPAPEAQGGAGGQVQTRLSASAKKRATFAEKMKKKADAAASKAIQAPPAMLGIDNGVGVQKRQKGEAKGGKKGEGKGIPRGTKNQTADGKRIFWAYNHCEKCVQEPCIFEHVCWWCLGKHPGKNCPGQ